MIVKSLIIVLLAATAFSANTGGKALEWTGNIECGGSGSLAPK